MSSTILRKSVALASVLLSAACSSVRTAVIPVAITVAALIMVSLSSSALAQESLSPPPVLHFDDINGAPLSGGELFTYVAGTTTKQNTYTSSTGGTPNTNPIILNTRGEANVWINPSLSYKFVLAPAGSSDPPSAPIFTVDNITSGNVGVFTGQCVSTSSNIPPTVGTVCVNGTAANTQTLPASPVLWEKHTILDATGNAATYSITIAGNGNTVGGFANFILKFNRQSIDVQWDGTQWDVE